MKTLRRDDMQNNSTYNFSGVHALIKCIIGKPDYVMSSRIKEYDPSRYNTDIYIKYCLKL
jgi:hypothetical protein